MHRVGAMNKTVEYLGVKVLGTVRAERGEIVVVGVNKCSSKSWSTNPPSRHEDPRLNSVAAKLL